MIREYFCFLRSVPSVSRRRRWFSHCCAVEDQPRQRQADCLARDRNAAEKLRRENQRLKKIVADQAIDIVMLKELNRNF